MATPQAFQGIVPTQGRGGTIPLATRHRRTASWDPWHHQQRVEINYSKLRELCLHRVLRSEDDIGPGHAKFMAEYPCIFHQKPLKRSRSCGLQRHSCSSTVAHSHNVSSYTVAIHGRDPKEQQILDTTARLKAMHTIVKKLPVQRTSSEVQQLAQHLSHSPGLLPSNCSSEVVSGVASRALSEDLPKQGYSLPGQGGVYLILHGSVEKISRDSRTTKTTSTVLQAGQIFGKLENEQYPLKSSYPAFVTLEPCALMRITAFDYEKVLKNYRIEGINEKQQLINSCPLLHAISPAILSTLAEAISWETVQENTTLLQEGQIIDKIGFVQQGKCLAYARIPHTSRPVQVCIGELGAGSCVGELLLLGRERQPYSTVAVTRVRVGWVAKRVIKANDVEKHILSDSPLAVSTLDEEQLRDKYASKLLDKHWSKIRQDIVSEVFTERGIRLGHSKWKHFTSISESGHKAN